MADPKTPPSDDLEGGECHRSCSGFTALQRAFSYAAGDEHARRLIWLVRLYCALFRVGSGQRENLEGLR